MRYQGHKSTTHLFLFNQNQFNTGIIHIKSKSHHNQNFRP